MAQETKLLLAHNFNNTPGLTKCTIQILNLKPNLSGYLTYDPQTTTIPPHTSFEIVTSDENIAFYF